MCTCIELKKGEYSWSIDVGLKKCDDSRSMDFVLVVGLLIIFCWSCSQIEKLEDGQPGKYRVTGKYDDGMEFTDEFNTVSIVVFS